MKKLPVILIALGMSMSTAIAETIVKFGTEYPNHTVTEGYAGDIEKIQSEQNARLSGQDGKSAVITIDPEEQNRHSYYNYDVSIADVKTSIYSDADNDGYYTHFSLNFDVDNHYGYEYVYAKIYLRKDDSNYKLFHVTDVFEIYSNFSSDRYKVDSKLVSNFPAAYYDVKIEVLIAGKTGVQDEVDANSHRALYALPLESDRLDGSDNEEIIVHEHAGAFSATTVLVLFLFGMLLSVARRKTSM